MNFYVIQVITGSEENFIKNFKVIAENACQTEIPEFFFPQKKLIIRKSGLLSEKLYPLFPGYIFLKYNEIDNNLLGMLKSSAGFCRFLPDNKKPESLKGKDLELILHFTSFGAVADISTAKFDENDRIQIVSGPLKGLEGCIIKVDRRKKRVKVKLDFYENSFLIDLGFEIIQ